MKVRINSAGRVRCGPGWSLDQGWSNRLRDLDFWFVWAGRGVIQLTGGRRIELRPGVAIWMRPGGTYLAKQHRSDRLGVTYVHFDMLSRPVSEPGEVHEVLDVGYADALLRRVVELAAAPRQMHVAEALFGGLLLDVLSGRSAAASGTALHHRQAVLEAATLLREQADEPPQVAELARRAGYSPDHFARLFKSVLGVGPQAFRIQSRIDRAKGLLTESSLTITQIAQTLRYENIYFFSRQFKAKTGLTPSDYRRRAGLDADSVGRPR